MTDQELLEAMRRLTAAVDRLTVVLEALPRQVAPRPVPTMRGRAVRSLHPAACTCEECMADVMTRFPGCA